MEEWNSEQRQAFGARLQQARKAKGMTLVEVGVMFDTSKQTVSHWETGRNMPSAEQVARMADEFATSVEWLLFARRPAVFSPELQARLSAQDQADFLRIENQLRVMLDLPLLQEAPNKAQSWKRAAAG